VPRGTLLLGKGHFLRPFLSAFRFGWDADLHRTNAAIAVKVANRNQEAAVVCIAIKVWMVGFEEHVIESEKRSKDEPQKVRVFGPFTVSVDVDFITVHISAALRKHRDAAVGLQFLQTSNVALSASNIAVFVAGRDEEVCVSAQFRTPTKESRSMNNCQRMFLTILRHEVDHKLSAATIANFLFNGEVSWRKTVSRVENGDFIVAAFVA